MFFKVIVVFLALVWHSVAAKIAVKDQRPNNTVAHSCEFYDRQCFKKNPSTPEKCHGIQRCETENHSCVVTWKLGDGVNSNQVSDLPGLPHKSGHMIMFMGCYTDENYDVCGPVCHADGTRAGGIYFCCCTGFLCNANFTFNEPLPAKEQNATLPEVPTKVSKLHNQYLYAIIPALIVLGVLFGASIYIYRQRKVARYGGPLGANNEFADLPSGVRETEVHRPIKLLEIKARGRFGAVWKGELKLPNNDTQIVAVKIFPLQDKASWQAEQDIYNLPRIEHENILKYLGVEKRGENLQLEFWLTSEFHERGSLCDFLKSTVLSWDDLCRIAISMARGLTHLHEEIPQQGTGDMKPAIAHRDFKSKNVLIKSDMTACIADFGLALIFEPGKSCGDTHGQVGTRRYMAPEVLEGAINFSRDAFLRIDMYACGLVLWELATRCTAPLQQQSNQNSVNLSTHRTNSINTSDLEYKLPFEAEISNPGLEQMRELVVNKKARPVIKDQWRHHPGMAALCDTIEECWDQDAEARLSASCVMERIRNFQLLQPPPSQEEFMNALNSNSRQNASSESTPLLILNTMREDQDDDLPVV